jgi:asparagine synthase (glutamine-hydrolysing)
VERLLHPERLHRQGYFRRQFYDSFVAPHLQGRADFTWQVWAAFMFQLWHAVYVDQKRAEPPVCRLTDLC